jgi:MFS family permease
MLSGIATVFAIGECVHSVVHGPVIVDLAPPHLLGRYISILALTVTGGFAIGPAIGGAVLAYSPDAVWWGGALVAGVIGVGFLLAGDRIPDKPIAAMSQRPRPATLCLRPHDRRRRRDTLICLAGTLLSRSSSRSVGQSTSSSSTSASNRSRRFSLRRCASD